MQNQWFRNPDKAREIFAKYPDKREELIARFLFAGRGLSGRRLRAAFGEFCDKIVWEESSVNFGGESSSLYLADMAHIKRVLEKHKPDIVLAFGKVASNALMVLRAPPCQWNFIPCRHPAARDSDIQMRLERAAVTLKYFMMPASEDLSPSPPQSL